MAGVFVIDLVTPLGLTAWLGYVVPILLVSRTGLRKARLILTAVCSVLVVAADAGTCRADDFVVASWSMGLGVLWLWITTMLLVRYQDAQDALQESQRRFQLAMDAADEGLWDRHCPTSHVYRSPRFYSMLGYEPGEIAESVEGWIEFMHPDDREEAVRKVEANLQADGGMYEAEYRMKAKDGQWRWLRSRGKVVERDAQGRVVRTMGTHADITDHKKMEKEQEVLGHLAVRLAASSTVQSIVQVVREETETLWGWDAYYFAVQNKSMDGYAVVSFVDTVNGRKQEFPGESWSLSQDCPIAKRLFGTEARLLNRSADSSGLPMTPFGDETRRSASIMTVPVCSGTSVIGALSIQSYTPNRYRDTDLRTLQRIAAAVAPAMERAYAEQALREAHDELEVRVRHRTADLTQANLALQAQIVERKRVETALRESETRFRLAMEATRDGLWDWNTQTDETYLSPGYYRMLGYEPDECAMTIGTWLDHIHPEDRDEALRANHDCIDNHVAAFEVEFRMRTKGGDWRWILSRGRAVARDAQGRAVRLIGTHVDITERKRVEATLRRNRQDLVRLSHDREKLLEDERARISSHLHDEIGQSLTFLLLQLARIEKRIQGIDPALGAEVQETCDQAKRLMESVRATARSLRPISIEHDGLIPAIRTCVAEFERASGVACRLECRLHDVAISPPVATTLYRIVQEALTNVARHANASRCDIRLTALKDEIELRIHDNGQGGEASALRGHQSLGVVGMRERAAALGGKLHVRNGLKAGVVVSASFPTSQGIGSRE
jgi:two-component system sensor histidine kinase UhpB